MPLLYNTCIRRRSTEVACQLLSNNLTELGPVLQPAESLPSNHLISAHFQDKIIFSSKTL